MGPVESGAAVVSPHATNIRLYARSSGPAATSCSPGHDRFVRSNRNFSEAVLYGSPSRVRGLDQRPRIDQKRRAKPAMTDCVSCQPPNSSISQKLSVTVSVVPSVIVIGSTGS